jgi:DNA polymerase elongation subunit (family B)
VGDAVRRARTSLALIEQLDLVGRTGETGRAFGIDFLAVLYRGSQYRVESLMARLAHSQNYLLPSPSKEQVHRSCCNVPPSRHVCCLSRLLGGCVVQAHP